MSEEKNNKSNLRQSVFTRETFGVVTVLFATLCLVCLITGEGVFSLPGLYVSNFLYGTFGLLAYAVVIEAFIIGFQQIVGKNFGFSAKRKGLTITAILLIALIGQIISMASFNGGYGEYLTTSYLNGQGGFSTATFGGIISALISYPISALLTSIGGGIVLGIILAIVVYFLVKDVIDGRSNSSNSEQKFRTSYVESQSNGVEISGVAEYPLNVVPSSSEVKSSQKLFVSDEKSFALKSKKELAKGESSPLKVEFTNGNLGIGFSGPTYSEVYTDELKKKIEYIKTPSTINVQEVKNRGYNETNTYQKPQTTENNQGVTISEPISREEKSDLEKIPFFEHTEESIESKSTNDVEARAQEFASRYATINESENVEKSEPTEVFRSIDNFSQTEMSDVQIDGENSYNIENYIEDNQEDNEDSFSLKQPRGNSVEDLVEFNKIEHIEEQENQIEDDNSNELDLSNAREDNSNQRISRSNVLDSDRARRILFGEDNEQSKVMGDSEASLRNFEQNNTEQITPQAISSVELPSQNRRSISRDVFASHSLSEQKDSNQQTQQPIIEEKPQKVVPPINRVYNRPPLDLLESYVRPVDAPVENHQAKMDIIKETLEQFRINAEMSGFVQGPSITRYELKMPAGISVKRVLPYDDDLKMRLESKDGVRIEAPIPGKNLVGIEVANKHKVTVGLKEVLEGASSKPEKKGALTFAIGKDIVGNSIVDNLAEGPHFLVAGSTGSGKSVCLNLMIVSMIMKYSPEDLRLILVDPKGVEFRPYEHLPHLMVDEIVTEPKKALAVLKWAHDEMERRYAIFREHPGIVKIDAYNSEIANDKVAKMPRIVIVVDELSNLMETCKRDMEARILSIAQKARAAGIHLVLATQRPSVDVITGVIKANLPSRIALRVMNFADSNTILSEGGAEKLLGNGDMLYKNSAMSECERYQGAYISAREVNNVVQYIIENNTAYFDDDLKEFLENETNPKEVETSSTQDEGGMSAGNQDLFVKSLWFAINSQMVSISQLQRRFQIGYARAGALVDRMERMGYISANEGSKARRVFITREQMEEKYGPEAKETFDWY